MISGLKFKPLVGCRGYFKKKKSVGSWIPLRKIKEWIIVGYSGDRGPIRKL